MTLASLHPPRRKHSSQSIKKKKSVSVLRLISFSIQDVYLKLLIVELCFYSTCRLCFFLPDPHQIQEHSSPGS